MSLLAAAELLEAAGCHVAEIDDLRRECVCGWQTRTMDVGSGSEPKTIVKRRWHIDCPTHGIKTGDGSLLERLRKAREG